MSVIHSKFDRLLKVLADDCTNGVMVTLADGTRRRMSGAECIALVDSNPDKIGRVEGGHLGDLLNALLEM